MKRLKWVCDKKIRSENLNQGRPKPLAFNRAEYVHPCGGHLGILAIRSSGFVK